MDENPRTSRRPTPRPAEGVPRRQLERSVSLTRGERFRSLWYRLRLTIAEMNYASRRLTELQYRLPGEPEDRGPHRRLRFTQFNA
jgi:hypothetical protein